MPLDHEQNGETVTPEVVETELVENQQEPTPETDEKTSKEPEDEAELAQKGVQKRIDRLTRQKYEARAEADFLRKQLESKQQPSRESEIDRSQYSSDEDYVEAIVESRLAQKEQHQHQQSFAKRVDVIIKEAAKLGDFDAEDFREVPITRIMADAIVESDVSAQLVKFFHDDPDEAERISYLSPARQAAAIGKLEAQINADGNPKVVTKTGAPKPIKPIAGKGSNLAADPSDTARWIAERNKQQFKKR